jgi:hypothetical protein
MLLDTVSCAEDVENFAFVCSLVKLEGVAIPLHVEYFLALEVKRLLALVERGLEHHFLFETFATLPLRLVH